MYRENPKTFRKNLSLQDLKSEGLFGCMKEKMYLWLTIIEEDLVQDGINYVSIL